jgi:hypothetical protein
MLSCMARRNVHHELNDFLDRHGYHHSQKRKIHEAPTGRLVFAEHERDHHITTSGRRALSRSQFALPPGPEEERREIKGRLPIDTFKRAHAALARASMMHHLGHISAGQLKAARRVVHKAWPRGEAKRVNTAFQKK